VPSLRRWVGMALGSVPQIAADAARLIDCQLVLLAGSVPRAAAQVRRGQRRGWGKWRPAALDNHPAGGDPVAHTSPNPLDGSATPEGTPTDPPTLPTGRAGVSKRMRWTHATTP
jgi:hypothetical protein